MGDFISLWLALSDPLKTLNASGECVYACVFWRSRPVVITGVLWANLVTSSIVEKGLNVYMIAVTCNSVF